MDTFDAVGAALDTLDAAVDALSKTATKAGVPRHVATPTLGRMRGYCDDMRDWLKDLRDEADREGES